MWTLPRPSPTASNTFKKCISRVRDQHLKMRLQAMTDAVEIASSNFDKAAEGRTVHELKREDYVGKVVTREEMTKVYTDRMAKKGTPGREIYDEIFISSPQGRCPLCTQRTVTTLDHYLPKAYYPSLVVTPLNLVPSCLDCNKAKQDDHPLAADDVFLHPYYDKIDEDQWLVADVIETTPATLRYKVAAPCAWSETLTTRVKKYFNKLSLGILYGSEAAEELVNIRHQLKKLYDDGGLNSVRRELETRASSCDAGRRNGWRTAAYRAWADSDWFCDKGFALTE